MKKRMISLGLAASLLLTLPLPALAAEQEDGIHTIAVAVYDPDASEMEMFMDYYRDYIEAGFSVKFLFSGSISGVQDEIDFIENAAEAGAEGVISFAGMEDLPAIVESAANAGLYYVLGSGSISDEDYAKLKENEYYLGSVGPEASSVYDAGRDMAAYFLEKGSRSVILMSGGASSGNSRHASRTQGMLDVFAEEAGLVLDGDSETAAQTSDILTLSSEDGTFTVTVCPGYTENGPGRSNLETVLAAGTYDTLMSAFHVSTYLDVIAEKEREQDANIMVGSIDSFTETNFEIFKEDDPFGNAPIDYVEGKYASMAGPAFAMMLNAVTGSADITRENGEAARWYQGFWRATGKQEYTELYGYATGIYENAYSNEDLMEVIRVFNPDATCGELKSLTESWSVEDAKQRIFGETE